ncbi:MAG: hypothetical protein QNL04_03885 [SAR324 cluster bacterium]|nr:hypothetical protein [SAR324 cluster bacterium]
MAEFKPFVNVRQRGNEINMSDQAVFPVSFGQVLALSFDAYKKFFPGFFFLGSLSYLPFFLLAQLLTFENTEILGLVHGLLLDTIVFLALPTIYSAGKIFPLTTLQIFQRFFTSAILISFAQLFFMMIGLVGAVPLMFLIFAGQFLILNNHEKLVDVIGNLKASAKLAKDNFGLIFWSFMGITLICILPEVVFRLGYVLSHSEIQALALAGENGQLIGADFTNKVFNMVEIIASENGFQMWNSILHLVSRPFKAIFMAFLFLGCLNQIDSERIKRYLQISATDNEELKPSPQNEE